MKRIEAVLSSKESYNISYSQDYFDRCMDFLRSYIDVIAHGYSHNTDLFNVYNNLIRFMILDKGNNTYNGLPKELTRLTMLKHTEPFGMMKDDAKRELETLLTLWSELYHLAYTEFLNKTHEVNQSELLERNNLTSAKRQEEKVGIVQSRWTLASTG